MKEVEGRPAPELNLGTFLWVYARCSIQ